MKKLWIAENGYTSDVSHMTNFEIEKLIKGCGEKVCKVAVEDGKKMIIFSEV